MPYHISNEMSHALTTTLLLICTKIKRSRSNDFEATLESRDPTALHLPCEARLELAGHCWPSNEVSADVFIWKPV